MGLVPGGSSLEGLPPGPPLGSPRTRGTGGATLNRRSTSSAVLKTCAESRTEVQRVQIRQPAQGGVGDRPLLQRPAGAAGSGQSAPLGVQAHQGVGMAGLLVTCGHEERPDRCSRQRSRRHPSSCPPTGSCRQRRPPGVRLAVRHQRRQGRGPGQIGTPVTGAVRCPAHGMKDAPRRSPECSPLRPPSRRPMHGRSPVRSPLRPPTPGESPTVPAAVHLVVPRTGRGAPETVAVHLVVPRPSSGWQ
jgi:hypothetical protein